MINAEVDGPQEVEPLLQFCKRDSVESGRGCCLRLHDALDAGSDGRLEPVESLHGDEDAVRAKGQKGSVYCNFKAPNSEPVTTAELK